MCLRCPYGKFSARLGADTEETCGVCPLGTYSPEGSAACRFCPANLYTDGVNPGCLACPAYSTSVEGATLNQCLCDVGYAMVWRQDMLWFTCSPCGAGTYTPATGAVECLSCDPGTYTPLWTTMGGGEGFTACLVCQAGSYSSGLGGAGCTNCSRGFVQASAGQSACAACTPGTFSNTTTEAAALNCLECEAGTYSPSEGGTNCSVCTPGSYANDSMASACRQCEPGKYAEVDGSVWCWPCDAGTFSAKTGLANGSACTPCKAGSFSIEDGAVSGTVCTICPAGFTSDPGASNCTACPVGELANHVYGACAGCPVFSTPPENITSLEQCQCDGGYYLGYNAKAIGGVETYESGPNGQLYKIHTFNTYSEGIWVLTVAEFGVSCQGAQFFQQYIWLPGVYPPKVTAETCVLPYIMSYPVDAEFDASKTTSMVQCVTCPKGTFNEAAGGYWDDCLACPAGKYQDAAGQTSCHACPEGTVSNPGADICQACRLGTVYFNFSCTQCPDGYYAWTRTDHNASAGALPICVACPNNTWSNALTGGCRQCPEQSSSNGGTGMGGCKCADGLELSTYSNIPYCIACAPGKFSASGSNVCAPCPTGSYGTVSRGSACIPCRSEHAWFAPAGSTRCSICPIGTTASVGTRGNCTACPRGSVCQPESAQLLPCPVGTYDAVGGLRQVSECLACPANSFCVSPTSIEACPFGTYSLAGAKTKRDCLCTDQYDCTYTTSTTTRLALSVSQAEWEAQRQQLLASIAASLGTRVLSRLCLDASDDGRFAQA